MAKQEELKKQEETRAALTAEAEAALTAKADAALAADQAKVAQSSGAVAVIDPANAQPIDRSSERFVTNEMEAMAGAGAENVETKDLTLPRLTLLQSLSPQLKPKKVEFIEGAQVGDWCDVSTGTIFRGPVEVIPCHFSTQYLEWRKGRAGFAGNHGMDASCLKETTLDERRQNVLPNGNIIAETATWYCLLHVGIEWRRVFLPFSSTGLKSSRKWMTLVRAERLYNTNNRPFMPPMFYRPWLLTPAEETNEKGDWFGVKPSRSPKGEDIEAPKGANAVALNDRFKTIYDVMAEEGDGDRWLLNEAKAWYVEARDKIVVGAEFGDPTEDMNQPDNAMRNSGQGGQDRGDDQQHM